MEKNKYIIILVILAGVVFYGVRARRVEAPSTVENLVEQGGAEVEAVGENKVDDVAERRTVMDFQPPVSRASERVTKKPFGLFVTPQSSPVQPEKFRGYHTGADFEIFAEEQALEVVVRAVCAGELKAKRVASGYGGVVVQVCHLATQSVTVIYGHLQLASVKKNMGEHIAMGETIGVLGAGYSAETAGERKHLHLGIHEGVMENILGYVQAEKSLNAWINPCPDACHNN